MTPPPLTDEQLDEIASANQGAPDHLARADAIKRLLADARWHRAELAKARAETCQYAANLTAVETALTKEMAENERLREALVSLEAALLKDSRQKSIVGDDTEYHLDGNSMYHAINKVRAALAPEGKETK